ncbi:PAS domain-containing protein [Methylobacterium sp. 37f]|uniref:PAS domain-containing protein n=1 Tax=Methylobacterium sp. 37f TaxID=2817058 RepID=UPI001FFC3BAB|nr:PAS domain-containing protein [Methylobacterium sp. 37f]MCK2053627.1 PAS domain-containing protein [Methylobacterium sp. 37f]
MSAEAGLARHPGEARYRTLFDSIEQGFCVIEFLDGPEGPLSDYIHIEANPAYTANSGIPDAVGKRLREIVGAEADEWVHRYAAVLRTGVPIKFEQHLVATGRDLAVTAHRVEPASLRQVAVLFSDITARRQTELALQRSEQTLDALIRSSSEVRYRINADWTELDQLAGGNFIPDTSSANRNWLDEYIPAADREAVRAEIARAIRTQSTYSIEHRVNQVDGTIGWAFSRAVPLLDAEGNITEWYGAASDITARRRAEIALRELNDTLEARVAERTAKLRLYGDLVEASVAPICAFDTEFRLIAFNQAHSDEFHRIFAYRVQLGDVFPDLFPPDQAPVMRNLMERALTGEAFSVTEEFGDPDRVKPYWEVSYSPLRDDAGQVIGAFHYARDISARLRAEAELTTTQDTLRQSQKLEAVGQLTGGVAHDFNNLLTVIKSSTDLLKRPDLSDERRARYIGAISDTVERAARLTNQLLAFSRRQPLTPEVFDACESLRRTGEMIRTLTGSRIRITTELSPAPCYINADMSQFDTALVNMAVNARDAMDGEGELTVAVRPVEQIPVIRSHPAQNGTFVSVSVTNTGSGIAPEQMERIFEPFFTTKEVGKGTGLGLSQVFGFAKQSGGDVDVSSRFGHGTTFTLYLPRAEGGAGVIDSVDPDALLSPLGYGQGILIVEDNIEVGLTATQLLEDLGCQTELVVSGEAALERLQTGTETFRAVFSDVVMPGMGGLELAKAIRSDFPGLPVVLTSGYSHVLAGQNNHGFELLQKPYSAEQVGRVLRRLIGSPSGAADSRRKD